MRNTIPILDLRDPDELIRANGAAEAAQTDRLREEVSDYMQAIEQLRELCDRNSELVQKLQFMNRSQTDEIQRLLQENNEQVSRKLSELHGWDTKELQEQIGQVTAEIGSSREAVLTAVQSAQAQAAALQQQSDDFSHKENVRVYRNIQASMIAELGKQTQELSARLDALQEAVRPDPSVPLLRKVSFGLLVAVLAIQLLEGVGLLSLFLSMR